MTWRRHLTVIADLIRNPEGMGSRRPVIPRGSGNPQGGRAAMRQHRHSGLDPESRGWATIPTVIADLIRNPEGWCRGGPSFPAEAGIHRADGLRCVSIVILDLIQNPQGGVILLSPSDPSVKH